MPSNINFYQDPNQPSNNCEILQTFQSQEKEQNIQLTTQEA